MEQTEIIQKVKENKLGKVYKELHKAYPSIKKWIISNSGAKQDAEDVFQEVILIFIENVWQKKFSIQNAKIR